MEIDSGIWSQHFFDVPAGSWAKSTEISVSALAVLRSGLHEAQISQ
jgi:hypothetical protein